MSTTKQRYAVDTEAIAAAFNERGLKMNWVAHRLGIHPTRFSQFINGHVRMPATLVAPLAQELGVTVAFIRSIFYITCADPSIIARNGD